MPGSQFDNYEERELILRDKIAREGFDVPDDVVDYIASRSSAAHALKAALINVSAYAHQRRVPITMSLARLVLEGIRQEAPEPGASDDAVEPVADTTITVEDGAAVLDPDPDDIDHESIQQSLLDIEADDQRQGDSQFDAPKFLDGVKPAVSVQPADYEQVALFTEPPAVSQPVSAAEVWLAPIRTERKKSLIDRAVLALKRAGVADIIAPGDKVAIKVHFGERGNTSFVSPIYVREVVRLVKELGGTPFLTDANTLYKGMRDNAADHIVCALENGFSYATVGAPIVIADGLNGHEGTDVPVAGAKHCSTVRIGSAAVEADAMIVISHVKGHGEAGFGGAIKNVGMGLGTRSAKQRMHSDVKPQVKPDACTLCGRCAQWCPVPCIDLTGTPTGKAYIDSERCIGCGECVAACSYGAIAISWAGDPSSLQEKMAEHAAGALAAKNGKVAYLSFLTNISPECDCWSFSDAPIVPDIGVLASRDIVAIDQASYDMVTQAVGILHTRGEGLDSGVDKFHAMHGVDGQIAMRYAEQLGLGTRRYEVKNVG